MQLLCACTVQPFIDSMALPRKCSVIYKVWSGVVSVKRALSVNTSMLNKVTVCVEGNIGCGKTTFISHFQKYADIVEKCEEPVNLWREYGEDNPLSALYRDPKRWAYTFQSLVLLTLLQRHDQQQVKHLTFILSAHLPQSGKTRPVRVMERSVHSARYCFVENLKNSSVLTEFEYILLNEWFKETMKMSDGHVDLIVYLRTSPEVCYQRIKRRNRPEEQNITLEYLQQLHDLHENWLIKGEKSASHVEGDNSMIRPSVLIVDGNHDKKIVKNRFAGIHSQIMSELKHSLS